MHTLRCNSAFIWVRAMILCLLLVTPLLQASPVAAQSDTDRGSNLLLEIAAYGDDSEGASAFYNSLSSDDQAIPFGVGKT